jgi:hypothetical protein
MNRPFFTFDPYCLVSLAVRDLPFLSALPPWLLAGIDSCVVADNVWWDASVFHFSKKLLCFLPLAILSASADGCGVTEHIGFNAPVFHFINNENLL